MLVRTMSNAKYLTIRKKDYFIQKFENKRNNDKYCKYGDRNKHKIAK